MPMPVSWNALTMPPVSVRSRQVAPAGANRFAPNNDPRFGSGLEVGLGLLPWLAGGLAALGSGIYLAVRKIRQQRQQAQEEEMFRKMSQGGCCGFDSPERKSLNSCCKLDNPESDS